MKRVLIVTYYWPPSGGSGVQRWLKFSKYLPGFGWEPIILTPENPSFINQDPSLLSETSAIEVIRLPIWEPYQVVDKLSKKPAHQKEVNLTGKQSLREKLMVWIRGNLFIPDPRKYWIRPASNFIINYLKDSGIDVIVTTGPPHSLHLVGRKVKKETGIRWIADFRDPWSEWDVLGTMKLTQWARSRHRKLERKVLKEADEVISVGWEMDKDMKRLGACSSHVITNGFDPDDFRGKIQHQRSADRFMIRHIGSMDDQRDPRPFLELVLEMRGTSEREMIIEFIGNVNPSLRTWVEDHSSIREFVHFVDYIPHEEVISLFGKTDLLLLILAHSHSARLNITGKIFEYMASGCPVLGIGDPGGDASRVLSRSGSGKVFTPADSGGIRKFMIETMDHTKKLRTDLDTSPFSRKELTRELVKLLEK